MLAELDETPGLQYNRLTYSLIVNSLVAKRELAEAVETLYKMRDSGFHPAMDMCDQVGLFSNV